MANGLWLLCVPVLLCLLIEAIVALPLWKKEHISNG